MFVCVCARAQYDCSSSMSVVAYVFLCLVIFLYKCLQLWQQIGWIMDTCLPL